jgi:two-component system nitrate/nitrite response regulator NarL
LSTNPTIAIVSANEIEREGLRRILLEQSLHVAGVFGSHRELDQSVFGDDPTRVPIVVMEVIADDEMLQSCRDLRDDWPDCKLVLLAPTCDSRLVAQAFHLGIDGYVGKHISCACLVEMLKLVALGEKLIPLQIVFDLPFLRAEPDTSRPNIEFGDANLSDRETAILQGLIRGEPNKVISRRLLITEATVKVHVKSILRKLGVANRTQAAIWGVGCGLVGDMDSGSDILSSPAIPSMRMMSRSLQPLPMKPVAVSTWAKPVLS